MKDYYQFRNEIVLCSTSKLAVLILLLSFHLVKAGNLSVSTQENYLETEIFSLLFSL